MLCLKNILLLLLFNCLVKSTRMQYRKNVELAQKHIKFMEKVGKCSDPKPILVYPQTNGNEVFNPKATVSL